MPKYQSALDKIKNKSKKQIDQKIEQSSNESLNDEINDESENEYDEEEQDSEDKNFIADDDEVEDEIEQAKQRAKREQKKQKKLQNVKSEYAKKNYAIKNNGSDLEEDDYELINENNQKRKLKKLQQIQDDSSQNSNIFKQQKKHQSIFDDDNQIDSSAFQNKKVKNEIQESKMGLFDQSNYKKEDLQRKQQIFRKREDSTADDEERQSALNQQLQNLKDKFVVEDIDDLFCTQQDQEILNKDIPERLQLKLQDRFKPSQEELVNESQWIFDNIIESLPASKESLQQQRIQNIQQKIQLTLQYFRCDNVDIPQIISSRIKYLAPDLNEDSIWQIFNLDIEYGKYDIQKKQIKTFFDQIKYFCNQQSDEIQNYINSIYYLRNQKDLRDYEMIIDFYKSFYSQDLENVAKNVGKKLPGQKNSFVQNARAKKFDEFARKFLLTPSNFVENIQEDRLIHKPNLPPQKMKDLAKEYFTQNQNQEPGVNENQKFDKNYLQFIQDVCQYAAVELWCQPELRKIIKKYVKENGTVVTQPTEKGMKELDVLHSSYRVKRVNKRIQDIDQPDIYLDIIQNESIGLITYDIQVEKIEEFYNKIFDKYQSSEIFTEQEKRWLVARNEIKKIFCNDPNPMNKNQKNFLQIIIDEIKEELREDSENYILKGCKDNYQKMVEMGYFRIRDDEKPKLDDKMNNLNLVDDDFIQQRERLNVMGVILHPIDNRNFMTTIAIIDHYGELVAHRDFLNLIPPRVRRQDNNQQEQTRPGELEEKQNHQKNKRQFQEMLRQYQVDLIVVSADCLEARKLKKCLGEFASLKSYQEDDQSVIDNPKNEEDLNYESKEALVIWGRPEVPKLFASSHQSQKLLKNMPFVLKKAICLARFEQDPMNEIINLWSPIISENQALNLNLHPLQKLVNKARLMDCLEEVNIKTLNSVGIDINILIDHEHQHSQMQFLSGLGPRKAQKFIQKLKQRGQPLQNRMDIWENKIIEKSCFLSCVNFLKVKVPPEKRNSENYQINILDQTRINPRDYEFMQRIAVYCIFGNEDFLNLTDLKKVQAINELLRNPDKLRELQNSEFQDQINDQKVPQSERKQNENVFDQSKNIDKFIKDFLYPFRDPREDKNIVRSFDNQRFPSNELFYCLIDESERNFKKGIIVSANVIRVYQPNGNQPGRILCRLENGLDANIHENDAEFFGSVNVGSIVQGRVDQIKSGQNNDENFSVSLKCKQSDLRRHDLYVGNHEDVPEQDLVNLNFKVQEEQTQLQKKMQIQKRKIQHQRFQNWSSTVALQSLKKEDNGEFYFRPSSRGVDNLTLTWKFFENNIVHIDIKETEKAIGANIGSKLLINEDSFDNLQEIVERYITQCNRLVREVTQHQKFQKCNDMDELNQILLKEKQENESSIPYKFTILDEYPQFVILAYVPKKDVVREFLKVKPKGYFFHHQYQYPFQNLINWFKKQFKSREYQVYLRKAQSPQRVIQFANQQLIKSNQQQKISINEGDGMQIDSGNCDKWGQNNDVNPVKKENAIFKNQKEDDGWGDQSMKQSPQRNDFNSKQKTGWGDEVSSNVKDEKERGGWDDQKNSFQSPQRSENNFRGGAGRGRGGGQGGGRNCFKCGEEGHMSRECPNQDSKQKGMGRGGRQNKCFNCDQEGHMSKDCTEQKKERGGGSKCYNCQKDGHMSRDCPEPKAQRSVNKCFNCQQEGHMSRECPEPRKERVGRNGGDDIPYKRQRNDDGGSFRRQDNQEGWKNQNDGGDWGKNSQNDNNQNKSQDNGWGNAAGGWGDNNQDTNIQKNDNNQISDAWGNNDAQNNESNGWN